MTCLVLNSISGIYFVRRQSVQEDDDVQERDDEGRQDQQQNEQYWLQHHRRELSGYSDYGYQMGEGMQRMELVSMGFHNLREEGHR